MPWNLNFLKYFKKPKTKLEEPKQQPKIQVMRDPISIQRVETLHPKVRNEVKQILINAEAKFPKNIAIRIAQALRTWEEQDALYALGRTKVNPSGKTSKKPMGNIVTNAKGGQSFHNYAVAVDFVLLYDKDNNGTYEEVSWDTTKDFDRDGIADWNEVVASFEAAGWEWGGRFRTFKDLPHCQKTFGYSISQLRNKYLKKDFIPNTKYLNL